MKTKNMTNATIIAIKFTDNDFGNTFHGVLQTISSSVQWTGDQTLFTSKEKLVVVINEISTGMYMLFQNEFKYSNGKSMSEHFIDIKEYLKITEANIMIGQEVLDHFAANPNGNNSATIVLDLKITNSGFQIYFF